MKQFLGRARHINPISLTFWSLITLACLFGILYGLRLEADRAAARATDRAACMALGGDLVVNTMGHTVCMVMLDER